MTPPNIIYLHSHDTGRYIQPYGYGIPTPNLQRLAEGGLLFRQAFCASPTCSPSRAALLTGSFPHQNGMFGLAHFGFTLNEPNQHILYPLRQVGYLSILAGQQHIHKDSHQIGFDRVMEEERPIEERAAGFLLGDPPQPFFLDVGFHDTHRIYPEPTADENPAYLRPPAPLPDTPEVRQDMAGFVRSAKLYDQKVGVVLDALETSGLADNTVVICTTDHGLPFPAMKCNLTDHGTGVLLIIRGPGGFRGGRVSESLVSQVDLYPTICELAGVPKPSWALGRSLLPVAQNERHSVRDAVFAEVNFHVAYEPQRSVRTERWKYIRRFDSYDRPVLPNCDDSPSKTLWMQNGWRERPLAQEQLYDLIFDPNEACNLAKDQRHAAALAHLRGRLDSWMRETDDPLLRGALQWPAGFPFLNPDQISPSEIIW